MRTTRALVRLQWDFVHVTATYTLPHIDVLLLPRSGLQGTGKPDKSSSCVEENVGLTGFNLGFGEASLGSSASKLAWIKFDQAVLW
jgi:hypothetical protein